jgi:parallel beta helix pectate lyase-like protein
MSAIIVAIGIALLGAAGGLFVILKADQHSPDQPQAAATVAPTTPPATTAQSSPTPKPLPRPTPTPTPTSSHLNCVGGPHLCGFPDATNTGASGALTPATGDVTLSAAGQVYQNKNLRGCIVVSAPHVVIRNVKIACSGQYGIDVTSNVPTASATISHVTISCLDSGGTGIGELNLAVDHVDVSHCENGFDVDRDATITDTWCHDIGGYDPDCFQGHASQNVVIRHNTFIACTTCNSAIIDGCPGCSMNGFTVDGNLLSGGGYTLYCPAQTANPTNVSIKNNRFGTSFYKDGYATDCVGFPWSGNVRDSTGQSLAAA